MASVEDVRAAVANRTNRHGHLPESDREILKAAADKAETWWTALKAEQAKRELFQDPVAKVADIAARRDLLLREVTPILNQKPAAAPPAAAPPAAAAPVEAAAAAAPDAAAAAMDTGADAAGGAPAAAEMGE